MQKQRGRSPNHFAAHYIAQLAALRLKESISGWVCVSYKQNQNKKIKARLEAEHFVIVFVLFTFILAVLYFLFAFYDFGLLQMSRPAWAVHRLVVHSVGFHSTSFVIPMLLHVSRFWSLWLTITFLEQISRAFNLPDHDVMSWCSNGLLSLCSVVLLISKIKFETKIKLVSLPLLRANKQRKCGI